MFRRPLIQLPRTVSILCSRAGSNAVPLPPPSPIANIPEYVEPRWVAEEHMPLTYRDANKESRAGYWFTMSISVLMWTWILLGFWYEPEHVLGHHPWPNAKAWTDKELGIPSVIDVELPDEDVE